ncbi:hypothetical protein [Kitasatospora sp. NPDC093806]|uniref:hypothetical protein n=1 Tax=Kitasatospora sp. NPDC093806 TaxID=3155075 RepID=UPI00342B83B3
MDGWSASVVRRLVLAVRGRVWAATSGARPRSLPVLGLVPLGLLAAGLVASAAPVLWALTGCWLLVLGCAGALLGWQRGGGGARRAPDPAEEDPAPR